MIHVCFDCLGFALHGRHEGLLKLARSRNYYYRKLDFTNSYYRLSFRECIEKCVFTY